MVEKGAYGEPVHAEFGVIGTPHEDVCGNSGKLQKFVLIEIFGISSTDLPEVFLKHNPDPHNLFDEKFLLSRTKDRVQAEAHDVPKEAHASQHLDYSLI